MFLRRYIAAHTLLFSVLFFSSASCADNILKNSSFEEKGSSDETASWEQHVWAGKAEFAWDDRSRTGNRCVAISSDDGGDASWKITVPVQRYSMYRLSGWIRTEKVDPVTGYGALMNVHGIHDAKTDAVVGTSDWTRVSCEFSTGGLTTILVNCLFGGFGLATGKAWYDDLNLELIHQFDAKNPAATIDFGTELGKISPYIYGQFIEHLGRCIYGGIWAEMLVDRKFYHLVTSKHSPWKRVGGETGFSLTMDVERPYVDDWSIKIKASERAPDEAHGIIQHGLGVVQGREYAGHVVLAGKGTVEAVLRWKNGPNGFQRIEIKDIGREFAAKPIRFAAKTSTDNASLSIALCGPGEVWIGAVSLMPADNINGMRADTIAGLKELNSPIYRWPGGNFVSGYDWRDGIGPADRRPTRKNPAWTGLEYNDFGIDEFAAFCREIETEPLVVVNTGLGSPELAAALVEYANGPPVSRWGKRRAENGHPEPYDVKWWGIGNEMYGGWQLGHTSMDRYCVRHNEFVREMLAVDPGIKVVAVGASGNWSKTMLEKCAGSMDLLSEHFYCGGSDDLDAHISQIPSAVRAKAAAHRNYWATIPQLENKKVPIALDEWNYWYGNHLYGELGVRYYLKDALGIAKGIHEMTRNPDIFFMANYAQTVNVIGCIKTSKTEACFATTGLPLKLYRNMYGNVSVKVTGPGGPLDVVAALTHDKKSATIAVVNSGGKSMDLKLDMHGAELASSAKRFVITAENSMAFNEPGKPPGVNIEDDVINGFDPSDLHIPPISIVIYVVDIVQD